MAANRITYQDMMNPLFLHPSDNASSITVDKLQGSSDYRAWKRSTEINLSSKRKLGFLTGIIYVPTDDPLKTEMWEILESTNWTKRFMKPSKTPCQLKSITSLKTIWEELDALNVLPTVAAPQPDVVKLLDTINAQREEGRLFQFLNGLSDHFNVQRSQMLMLDPLSSVEAAYAATFEQEEAYMAVLNPSKPLLEIMAMNTKTQYQRPTCTACKGKGHTAEKCWTVVGYPKWHSRHNANASAKPRSVSFSQSKPVSSRMVVTAQVVNDASSSTRVLFTQQQLEQLALLIPQLQQQVTKESDTDEELDMHFSGMISSNTSSIKNDWIIDSEASDHMTACLNSLHDVVPLAKTHQIKLPTGDSVLITHTDFLNPISELNSDSTESSPKSSIHSPGPSVSTPHSHVSAEIQPLPPRKSSRAHLPLVWMKDFVTTNNAYAISTLQEWIDVMNQELDALELNNTWEVTKLPADCHAIGYKWNYKTKFLPDGSIDKHKARLVILGCHQKYGIDFAETFALMAKLTTIRTLLVVAAMENWFTCQMDVSNAFLHGDLSEDVYMKMPPVLLYVDDLLIAGNCSTSINTLKSLFSQTFHMKDMGPLTYFLGLEIHRDVDGIFMCQKKYMCDILLLK
ncbi:hypothetical protein AgCh_036596 [Apium graveolens]